VAHLVAQDAPLIVLAGPTASGKTTLALTLAERFDGEIVSCDSVAVYRQMEIGTAKPTPAERDRVPHHLLDVVAPNQPFTAGDYSRLARTAIADITARNKLPIVAGGTGLYLRALIEGLTPAPTRDEALRNRLRNRAAAKGDAYLHRLLTRIDPAAAQRIHPNDLPKIIRALEVSLAARAPQTEQWAEGRDPLTGYRILQLGLAPPRAQLYARINQRAATMFATGLVEETAALIAQYGPTCRALGVLGYAQAAALLRKDSVESNQAITMEAAIAAAQQAHRNYAKRQQTWFRRTPDIHWLEGFGDDPAILTAAQTQVQQHLADLAP